MNEIKNNENNIVFYTNDEGETKIEVILQDEDIWLTQKAMGEVFDTTQQNISLHINNIFNEKELNKNSVYKKILYTAEDNKKYNTNFYNLDMIIAVGYRVNSKKATLFRQWATKILKDYMIQGFALDDERFMKGKKTDKEYFKRLLERIKLIRTSERMFYQKITDVFSECSIDYDKIVIQQETFMQQYKINYILLLHTILMLK